MRAASRRDLLKTGVAVAALAAVGQFGVACDRRKSDGQGRAIVLYSSVDTDFLTLVVKAFEQASGVTVRVVGDTEATKTTGLVQRVIAEKDSPRADVWWSSEILGSIKLSRAGLLAPYRSEVNETSVGPSASSGWPARLRSSSNDWYAFASRPRVMVYNTQKVASAPENLDGVMANRQRLAIARPQFGTTRAHIAWYAGLSEQTLPGGLANLLRRVKASGLLLCDGNSSVVRAVARGEADVGLTDLDDVIAGEKNNWPVAAAYHAALGDGAAHVRGWPTIPNSIALVQGGANPAPAGAFIDFVLSARVEEMLASSDSRNWPVRATVSAKFPGLVRSDVDFPDWEAIEPLTQNALTIAERELGL